MIMTTNPMMNNKHGKFMPIIPANKKGRPRTFSRENALQAALRLFWEKGYEPATVAELCNVMGINPPSLYATFGNKADLFLEALHYYEKSHWEEIEQTFHQEDDVRQAIGDFFKHAARILLAPNSPAGCMVVLAAVNISSSEARIISEVENMRNATKKMFANKLHFGIQTGQLPADTDVPALAGALNALLEGLSLQAGSGICQCELKAMAGYAVRMLPEKTIARPVSANIALS